jgi:hypothetical protein
MGIRSRSCLAGLLVMLLATGVGAAAPAPSHDEERARDRDICGYRLMTERERSEYRARMHVAGSDEERARIREEHREQMKERARQRGFKLSCDEPDASKSISVGNVSKVTTGDGPWGEGNAPRPEISQ